MKEKVKFICMLMDDLKKSCNEALEKDANNGFLNGELWRNKNLGKTALKRKITTLRQELLNLERMIDNA